MRLAYAHDGIHADGLWSAWTLDPYVLVPLALAAYLYFKGVRRSWARAGTGRGVKRGEVAAFSAGMGALFFALVWPFDVLGERYFSAHMVQHLLLMNVAAPLVVLGAPLQVMLRALPIGGRRAAAALVRQPAWRAGWQALSGAFAAAVIQQVVLWTWHTPAGVAAALASDGVHIVMHLSLMAAALLFWTAVLRPRGAGYWKPIAALLGTLKLSGLVCIVLMLQSGGLYLAYGEAMTAWGLTRAEDEQLGWGLMMTVGTLSYLTALVVLSAISFQRLERVQSR